jgi:pimeloyl-ACP methyl ester carboxylesterase
MLNHHRAGRGEPLVLVHGIGSRWQIFAPVIDRLAAEHDVIAIDLPGFGASAPLDGPVNPTTLTDAVVAFADELGLERWHVVGNSMGGGIALELAARGQVASATAISPIGFWSPGELKYGQASLTSTRRLAGTMRERGWIGPVAATAVGRTLSFGQTFAKPWRLAPQECVETVSAFLDAPSFDEALAAFGGYRAPTDHGDVPVTIGWGTRDLLLLPSQAKRARASMPDAHHHWLHRCGHAPFVDDPALLATVIDGATRR